MQQPLVNYIDRLRANGATYDDAVAHLKDAGLGDNAKSVVDSYLKVRDQAGMPRAQVNPGDPAWRG